MNITVLANRDLASNIALNHLLPALARDHRVTAYLSDAVGGSARIQSQEYTIIAHGTLPVVLYCS